jgi:hypothetical protein
LALPENTNVKRFKWVHLHLKVCVQRRGKNLTQGTKRKVKFEVLRKKEK